MAGYEFMSKGQFFEDELQAILQAVEESTGHSGPRIPRSEQTLGRAIREVRAIATASAGISVFHIMLGQSGFKGPHPFALDVTDAAQRALVALETFPSAIEEWGERVEARGRQPDPQRVVPRPYGWEPKQGLSPNEPYTEFGNDAIRDLASATDPARCTTANAPLLDAAEQFVRLILFRARGLAEAYAEESHQNALQGATLTLWREGVRAIDCIRSLRRVLQALEAETRQAS